MLACLCITEAMSTTPTSAMDVLLKLTPLHLHTQRENQTPITQTSTDRHHVLSEYNFNKKYKTVIPQRKMKRRFFRQNNWYTDGSEMEQGTGAGIFGLKPRTEISLNLLKENEVFRAEILTYTTVSENY